MIRLLKNPMLLILMLIITGSCKKSEAVEGNEEIEIPETIKPDKVVAKDGSGDFTTVQAAVDAAPTGGTKAYLIYIKAGSYKEVITVPKGKRFIYFKVFRKKPFRLNTRLLCGLSKIVK